MTRASVHITIDGSLLLCKGWKVSARLREAGAKPIYSVVHGAYMVDARRLPDLLAYFDTRSIGVVVVDSLDGGGAA